MPVSRVSSSYIQNNFIATSNSLQSNLADLQRQGATEQKAQYHSQLFDSVSKVNSTENSMNKIAQYLRSNQQISVRLAGMETGLDGMQELSSEGTNGAQSIIGNAKGATQDQYPYFIIQLEQIRDQAISYANTKIEGRYLFAGGKTDTAPIDGIPTNIEAGVPDNSYYQGNTEILDARISDTQIVNYGITADNEAFQNFFTGINRAIEALENNDDEMLNEADAFLTQADSQFSALIAFVGTTQANLDNVNEFHNSTEQFLNTFLVGEINTDQEVVLTAIKQHETNLQALYSIYSTISNLKLSDFLR